MKLSYICLARLVTPLMLVYFTLGALPTSANSGSHGAHVHGIGELTLVMEGTNLEINFTAPAMDVLGFEHTAVTAAQLSAVENAKTKLRDAASLFSFTGAACSLRAVTVDIPTEQERGSSHPAEHSDHPSHGKDVSHADITAHYEFQCVDGEKPESLHVGKNGLPFGLQKINAMWVMEALQGAAPLTANQQRITFN